MARSEKKMVACDFLSAQFQSTRVIYNGFDDRRRDVSVESPAQPSFLPCLRQILKHHITGVN